MRIFLINKWRVKWNTLAFCMATGLFCAVPEIRAALPEATGNWSEQFSSFAIQRFPTPGVWNQQEGTVELDLLPQGSERALANWIVIFRLVAANPALENELFTLLIDDRQQLMLKNNSENGHGVITTPLKMNAGEPLRIAAVWTENSMKLYLRNQLVGTYQGQVEFDAMPGFCTMERSILNPRAMRISRRALSAEELSPLNMPFAVGDATTLIAEEGGAVWRTYPRAWQEDQCVDAAVANAPQAYLYREGDMVRFGMLAVNAGTAEVTLKAQLEISGRETQNFSMAIPPDGMLQQLAWDVGNLPVGFYPWTLRFELNEMTQVRSGAFSVLPQRPATRGAMADVLGQNGLDLPGLMKETDFRLNRAWDTIQLTWDQVQPEPGAFVWENADRMVAAAEENDLEVLAVLANSPYWAAEKPSAEIIASHDLARNFTAWKPKRTEDFRNYVKAVGERYRGRIRYYEIYNEVDFHPPYSTVYFSGTTAEYLELLKIAYEELKAIDPQNQVLVSGFALSTGVNDPEMSDDLLKMGATQFCDIWNMHGYGGTYGVAARQERLKALAPEMPYFQTEQAWYSITAPERITYLTPLLNAQFLQLGFARYYNHGTLMFQFSRHTRAPQSWFHTLAVLQNQLYDCERVELDMKPRDDYALDLHLRKTDGSLLTILSKSMQKTRYRLNGEFSTVRDIQGRILTLEKQEDGSYLTPETDWIYVVSPGSVEIMEESSTASEDWVGNGSFEQIAGDIVNLKGAVITGWEEKEILDPAGRVEVTSESHHGKYALSVASSGTERTNAQMLLLPLKAGTYRVSVWAKRRSGVGSGWMRLYDRRTGFYDAKKLQNLSADAFQHYVWDVTLPDDTSDACYLLLGVDGTDGAAEVLFDEVSLTKKPLLEPESFQQLSLPDAAPIPIDVQRSSDQARLQCAPAGALKGDKVLCGNPWNFAGHPVLLSQSDWSGVTQQEVTLPLPGGAVQDVALLCCAMYTTGDPVELLHWQWIYSDGSSAEESVVNLRDLCDWYSVETARVKDKALPVLLLDNPQQLELGAYAIVRKNPCPDKQPISVKLTATHPAFLVLLGAAID